MIVAIANQKGGVGKTTTAINLDAGLAIAERRTLVVDVDPQANATSGFGVEREKLAGSLYDVLVDGAPLDGIILPGVHFPCLDVAPSSRALLAATPLGREHRTHPVQGEQGEYGDHGA